MFNPLRTCEEHRVLNSSYFEGLYALNFQLDCTLDRGNEHFDPQLIAVDDRDSFVRLLPLLAGTETGFCVRTRFGELESS